MIKARSLTQKFSLIVLIVVLLLGALPATETLAASSQANPQPGQSAARRSPLKRIYHRLKRRVPHLENIFNRSDKLIERTQALIAWAAEKGLDTGAIQEALDAFITVLPDGKLAFAEAVSIVDKHDGFDEHGNVTNPQAALATIRDLRSALEKTNAIMNGAGKTLLQALRDSIQENRDALQIKRKNRP